MEHAPLRRMRGISDDVASPARLVWTNVHISLGTGRSDAPPMFICCVRVVKKNLKKCSVSHEALSRPYVERTSIVLPKGS